MITIRDALGPKWYELKLYDNNNLSYGGISKEEEILRDFINDSNLNVYEDSVNELQMQLKECGLCQIEIIDDVIDIEILKKINKIEEELNVDIFFKWDYH